MTATDELSEIVRLKRLLEEQYVYTLEWECPECGAVVILNDDNGDPSVMDRYGHAEVPLFCPMCGKYRFSGTLYRKGDDGSNR